MKVSLKLIRDLKVCLTNMKQLPLFRTNVDESSLLNKHAHHQ